jgi:hypothetical protein
VPGVDFKRKLAAIFYADVEGYSRFIGEDVEAHDQHLEPKTIRRKVYAADSGQNH